MPKDKVKPPRETKAELMQQIQLEMKFKRMSDKARVEYLLNFFTAADLVGIRDELRK